MPSLFFFTLNIYFLMMILICAIQKSQANTHEYKYEFSCYDGLVCTYRFVSKNERQHISQCNELAPVFGCKYFVFSHNAAQWVNMLDSCSSKQLPLASLLTTDVNRLNRSGSNENAISTRANVTLRSSRSSGKYLHTIGKTKSSGSCHVRAWVL